jgi:5-methylcytosine-specific restriction endonuclease McrA
MAPRRSVRQTPGHALAPDAAAESIVAAPAKRAPVMERTLVLNATYEPLTFIPVRRAVVLLLREKAEVVEANVERRLRSERFSMPTPLVIRLVTFIKIPQRFNFPFTRRGVLNRDNHTCQYCGAAGPLTVDHVVPVSRGGATSWDNCVACCAACNARKGDRTPDEAGMRLAAKPARPAYVAVAFLGRPGGSDVFRKYIF